MTALFWQTSLLLLAAYLIGAWSGCMMRRLLFSGRDARPAGLGSEAVLATPDSAPPYAPVRRVDPDPVRFTPARPSSVEPDPAELYARARDGGRPLESTPPRPQQEVVPEPAVGEPAEAAAPSSGSASFPGGLESAAARIDAHAPAAPAPPASPPSSGTAGAVGGLESVQAARVDTPAAPRQPSMAPPPSAPILPVATGSSGTSYVSAPVRPAPASAPDDLTRIRAIDEAMQSRLNQLGVTRFEQIAGWRPADVRRVGQELGFKGRIEQENWIEQAQILARNGETWYSERKARGAPALASPTPGEGGRIAVPKVRQDTAGDSAAKTVGRDILQRITGISAEVEKTLNDQGVTRYTHMAGWSQAEVAKFDQRLGLAGRIARENWLEQAQILARGGETAFSRDYDRRAHDDAVTEPPRPPKLADAIRDAAAKSGTEPEAPGNGGQRVDLSMLRSVRSEAFRGPDSPPAGSVPAALVNRVGRGASSDDLKRIRGVGVLIEKRLNAMGITTYEQIANWADADIARVSQTLDFKGRIERESWVEQARILASGGQTDFSRRLDRGDAGATRR